jgi:hypothetical protein
MNTYHVPIKLVVTYKLETGDYIEAKAKFNEVMKWYDVEHRLCGSAASIISLRMLGLLVAVKSHLHMNF